MKRFEQINRFSSILILFLATLHTFWAKLQFQVEEELVNTKRKELLKSCLYTDKNLLAGDIIWFKLDYVDGSHIAARPCKVIV